MNDSEIVLIGRVKPATPSKEVHEKCSENVGHWVCLTHPKRKMQTQLDKDGHIHAGKHVLAWRCSAHNRLEVP